MTTRQFIISWLAGTLALLTATAIFNVIVDPYDIYGLVSIAGFNQYKTQAIDQSRLTKPYLVARANPTTLLLGSSQIEVGFDPDSEAWPREMRPVFNLGMPGSSPYDQYRLLQHALMTAHPRYVIFGINFVDAHMQRTHRLLAAGASGNKQTYNEFDARLSVTEDGKPNPDRLLARATDMATTLLSLDALRDSFRTILSQNDPDATRITSLGFNTAAAFRALVRSDGEYNLFVDKDRANIKEIIQWSADPGLQVAPLARAIMLAQQHGAAVTVVISPVNADDMEIYRQAGVMKLYDDWREQVADMVAVAARSGAVSLWDFSAISPYTTEPLPPPDDRTTQLRWFWETHHFRAALGDVVIARIFDHGRSDFGTTIMPDTLAEDQANVRRLQHEYEETHPQNVKRVTELYDAGLDEACQSNPFFCHPPHPLAPGNDRDIAAAEQDAKPRLR